MKRLILTAICLLIFLSASAQEKKRLRCFTKRKSQQSPPWQRVLVQMKSMSCRLP